MTHTTMAIHAVLLRKQRRQLKKVSRDIFTASIIGGPYPASQAHGLFFLEDPAAVAH
ncbi:MAG: hypothetical protein ACYDCJ_08510 [Gammaproteobacteria bacterium]